MDVVYSNAKVVKPEPAFEMSPPSNYETKTTDPPNVVENGIVQPKDEGRESISFHNISYTVEQRLCLKKRPPKIILNDVRSVAANYCVM